MNKCYGRIEKDVINNFGSDIRKIVYDMIFEFGFEGRKINLGER